MKEFEVQSCLVHIYNPSYAESKTVCVHINTQIHTRTYIYTGLMCFKIATSPIAKSRTITNTVICLFAKEEKD